MCEFIPDKELPRIHQINTIHHNAYQTVPRIKKKNRNSLLYTVIYTTEYYDDIYTTENTVLKECVIYIFEKGKR